MTQRQLQNLKKKCLREGYKIGLKKVLKENAINPEALTMINYTVYQAIISAICYGFLGGGSSGSPEGEVREFIEFADQDEMRELLNFIADEVSFNQVMKDIKDNYVSELEEIMEIGNFKTLPIEQFRKAYNKEKRNILMGKF